MPVFISHRTADDSKAKALASHLYDRHSIKCYVDDFDPEAATTRRITDLILERLGQCTHLMALVTNATVGSWWVPFEIGAARQSDRRITTFDASSVSLPEYLKEWPVLTQDVHLDIFADAYHKDRAGRPILEKYAQYQRSIASASEFHTVLKSALRRP